MKEIVFVTGNLGKVQSAKKYFDEADVSLDWYKYDAIEPEINNIEFIATQKVMDAYKLVSKPCIAIDAGFYIKNFPGQPDFPGAFVNRELLDKNKIGITGMLEIMKDVTDRRCYFKECLAYYDGVEIKYFYGVSSGTLSLSIAGISRDEKWSDLWYVFIPKNHTLTLAEMSNEERNNRLDDHTSAFLEFANWCREDKPFVKKQL